MTSSREPIAAPANVQSVTVADARSGSVPRYAQSLTMLFPASRSAARLMPDFAPSASVSTGTRTSDPPSPADAETKNAIEIAARTSSMSVADSQKNDDPTHVPHVFTAAANSL